MKIYCAWYNKTTGMSGVDSFDSTIMPNNIISIDDILAKAAMEILSNLSVVRMGSDGDDVTIVMADNEQEAMDNYDKHIASIPETCKKYISEWKDGKLVKHEVNPLWLKKQN